MPSALPADTDTVRWRRSARARRITLRIDPRAAAVVVTLPMRASRAAGVALLADNAAWVAGRLALLEGAIRLQDGAVLCIDGAPCRIRHVPGVHGGAWIEAGELLVTGDAAFLPRRVADFLRAEARRRLGARAMATAVRVGLSPRRVVVKDTRARWGSCAPDGVLMFCWRLLLAPLYVQDYVVAHEVAHLRHMNHGAQFWALVEQLTPHRAAAQAWLRREGTRLLAAG